MEPTQEALSAAQDAVISFAIAFGRDDLSPEQVACIPEAQDVPEGTQVAALNIGSPGSGAVCEVAIEDTDEGGLSFCAEARGWRGSMEIGADGIAKAQTLTAPNGEATTMLNF